MSDSRPAPRRRPTDEELAAEATPEYLEANADSAVAAWEGDASEQYKNLLEPDEDDGKQ